MELEVRELFFELVVVLQIECLLQASCSIEEVYLSGSLFCLEQMHDVASHRSHTGTASYEDQFLVGRKIVRQEEFSVWA